MSHAAEQRTAARVELEGFGLHGGGLARLVVCPRPGPLVFLVGPRAIPLSALRPSGERRSTELQGEGLVVRTTEHLFAALAALGLHEGLSLELSGSGECPLLDGGARVYVDALCTLSLPPVAPSLVVVAAGDVRVGASAYRFTPPASGDAGAEPSVSVSVEVDFDDARLSPRASWAGDAADFAERIAPARTFGFARELGELADRGLASHVARESVVLVTDEGILSAGRAFLPDEPARHKLLDLVGDLFAWGGPPRGAVHAERPGHAATHAAVAEALARGLLALARPQER